MAIFWQRSPGQKKDVNVRNGSHYGLPERIEIRLGITDDPSANFNRMGAMYIQLEVPGVGPTLAWVGVPGGPRNAGTFIHPQSGQVWPRGQLALAVKYAIDYGKHSV